MYAVDGRLVVVSQLHAGIDEPDVFVRFEDFLHPFPGSFPLSVFESPFFQVEVSAFAHLRLEEDQRRRGMAFADAPDEPFQPLVDLLGRRVRKGVEQKGVGPGLRGDAREECIELALPAGPEVDEPESQGAAQACGVGHSRTASRSAVRDARPDHHNPVAEGVGSGFQQRSFVGSDFEAGDLVVQREVQQTLLHRRIHVLDNGGFVLRPGFVRHPDPGEHPFAVAANVEVEPGAGR